MITGYFRLGYRWFNITVLAVPGRVIALVFFIALFIIPFITKGSYVLYVLTLTAIFAIYSASWDVLAGYTGQLNLGHGLFFGVAAYTAAILNTHLHLPPWVTIPLGGLSGIIVGIIAGAPALRLRGFYLSLVTLSFPIILSGIVLAFGEFTGGEMGTYGVDRLSNSEVYGYYLVYLVMLFSIFIMYKFTDAESKIVRTGVILHSIREDEITARASGINTTKYKLLAFGMSAFFAGIAGGLYVHIITVAGPSTLELFFSLQPILWTIFGSVRTIYGPVAGVYILFPLMQLLQTHELGDPIRYIIFALILMFVILFMPEGITIWVRDKIEVKCQRCKKINIMTRSYCRACSAPLHLEKRS